MTRYWRYSKETMQKLEDAGKLIYSKTGIAYEKRYLDESKGIPLQDFWDDVSMLRGISGSGERLDYPTQKPLADLDGARNLAERDKYQFQWWACSLVNAQPYQGKKKGADSGIDGVIYFPHTEKEMGKIVVSVKGGNDVSVAMIRDFAHVIEREKAAMGLFVTLAPPTRPMMTEAASVKFYTSPLNGTNFSKLQVLTIEGLLNGTEQAHYPHAYEGGFTFKKAKKEEKHASQEDLF